MIHFFKIPDSKVIALQIEEKLSEEFLSRLLWLFSGAKYVHEKKIEGIFVGPRKEMVTPWSTNAVEITQNMGIKGIERIEEYHPVAENESIEFDPMLQAKYENLDQHLFTTDRKPDPILFIEDIRDYNNKEGLALSKDEVKYLEKLRKKLGRHLTDSEIFGFSQVNSEHCRHKIFNGTFIIDGKTQNNSLFQWIKKTTKSNTNKVISAYKDNCAFLSGPVIEQFAPLNQDKPDYFAIKDIESVLSLKAETHNFPTTVEPFNGAATGTGGEIRDRIGGGKAAMPLAGTAVYMTAYSRLENDRHWEKHTPERDWLYQTPTQILIKASNGASDFGNKFGQPLICGSVLTFEHNENNKTYGFDKVIMLAGGIGYGNKRDVQKELPEAGDAIVLLGGDNYRIGMGGGAVSSVDTGVYENAIELNAVQRSNPEMQKRVYNAIRAMAENEMNSIISIHDHGAGGHLNCLSELVETVGGKIEMSKLPVGDPTLSAKEIVGNESQERMGLLMKKKDVDLLKKIAERERAPLYEIGTTTGDHKFIFEDADGNRPIDLILEDMFGNPPKTIMKDEALNEQFYEIIYDVAKINSYLEGVLKLESVACKDWLTNKVDRSVTGKIATQQTAGPLQLPLNNVAVVALDFTSNSGLATSIGHAPVSAMINSEAGSRLAIAEALTNLVWAHLDDGLKSISLSANWMWPCKNKGEDARLYKAVKAASEFAMAIGINIPTGKDSLSMTQKYPDGSMVYAPGTVIISAAAEVSDIRLTVEPVLKNIAGSSIIYIPFTQSGFELGGSSLAQVLNRMGNHTPDIDDGAYFKKAFESVQHLIKEKKILAGHDVSGGGLITSLLEMCFGQNTNGLSVDLSAFDNDIIQVLFSEKPAVVIQVKKEKAVTTFLDQHKIHYNRLGKITGKRNLTVKKNDQSFVFDVDSMRDKWYLTSHLLDAKQTKPNLARERFDSYKKQEVIFSFPPSFSGIPDEYGISLKRRESSGIKTAIIREKGVNGDREMAYAMHTAGLDVKDVHMTDLISGRETLEDIHMIVFVGGFSNSDVLGSAKGWAGAFLYNPKAREALENFYSRKDTLSLGVCNGCQVMVELGLLYRDHKKMPEMKINASGKFESSFLNVDIPESNSVMLNSLKGTRLGIWVAHGEGQFSLPYKEEKYNIALKYSYDKYPGNPNGSMYNTAGICSPDGRHLAIMPHIERSIFPWNWAYYPDERKEDIISPWIEAFVNAREWIKKNAR